MQQEPAQTCTVAMAAAGSVGASSAPCRGPRRVRLLPCSRVVQTTAPLPLLLCISSAVSSRSSVFSVQVIFNKAALTHSCCVTV